jgi:hypothetical protein
MSAAFLVQPREAAAWRSAGTDQRNRPSAVAEGMKRAADFQRLFDSLLNTLPLDLALPASNEGHDEEYQENHKQDLSDPGCRACNSAKAKNGSDDCDHQKDNGVV